jgi:hypothetical protein
VERKIKETCKPVFAGKIRKKSVVASYLEKTVYIRYKEKTILFGKKSVQ